jgi:hypothetical protein
MARRTSKPRISRPWRPAACSLMAVGVVALGSLLATTAEPGSGSGETAHRGSRATPARAVAWRPVRRQRAERDTLFLLDPTRARLRAAGRDGGLIMGNAGAGDLPWTPTSKVAVVAGRYRAGLQSRDRSYGYLWMPATGLVPSRAFTIEMWLRADQPWSQVSDNTPFAVQVGYDEGLAFGVHRGTLSFTMAHRQSSAGPVAATLAWNGSEVQAGQWVSVAATYAAGTLRLYVDGTLAGVRHGVPPPEVWSDSARSSGLSIGGARGKGSTQMAISDLRISRFARVPGRRPRGPATQTLSVDPGRRTGARVRRQLLGGLHTLGGGRTARMARGAVTVLRTDKLLTATPIKLGGADGAHPSVGVSGSYSYDWRVVDRAFVSIERQGLTPYISIDSTPQILGGSVRPLEGARLDRALPFVSAFAPEVPRDIPGFGAIVRDLVHHVVVERRWRAPYWGVWNEPDAPGFWQGGLGGYLRLYDTVARAVKSVDPRLQVGGPETTSFSPTWIAALIQHCAAAGVPLDFVSWHYYSGSLADIPGAQVTVAALARRHGLGHVPQLVVGEWAWQTANLPGTGLPPFRATNFFLNDWAAAFAAASLVEMQRHNVQMAIYTNPVAQRSGTGFAGSGLMSPKHPWATLNVFRMWSRMAPRIVRTRLTARPGVFGLASRGRGGRLTVLLARLQYPPGGPTVVRIALPRGTAARVVRHYVVDARHSNAYDAGVRHAGLEAIRDGRRSRSLPVALSPRSVHLLVLSSQ